MGSSVYAINKGVNKPAEFKGLKAQYIWYLGGSLVGLLILFAVLYFIGINTFVCLGIILVAGTALFMYIYRLSNTHGEFGMMKKLAARHIPAIVQSRSRKIFRLPPAPSGRGAVKKIAH